MKKIKLIDKKCGWWIGLDFHSNKEDKVQELKKSLILWPKIIGAIENNIKYAKFYLKNNSKRRHSK